jgi:hypothetical protein
MGLINSVTEDGGDHGATTSTTSAFEDMIGQGVGYCPIYDAALVGDWAGLAVLCEGTTMTVGGDGGVVDDDVDDDHDKDGENDDDNDRMRWIASLDVFEGGQDYTHSADMASYPPDYPPDSSLSSLASLDRGRSQRRDDDRRIRRIRRRVRRAVPLLVDSVGNTALHLACRRDPPLSAVRALASTRPDMVWMTTLDGSLPLHLACHCGCDVDVAGEILDVMERTPRPHRRERDAKGAAGSESADDNDDGDDDPLFPRDCRGRTPLHLACASSRDPVRRPDLIRLLLLRSNDPRRLALSRDWLGGRLGLDCAMGQLTVIVGGLNDDDVVEDNDDDGSTGAESVDTNDCGRRIDDIGWTAAANGAGRRRRRSSEIALSLGRTPLDLIEDDYREELDDASFLPPGPIAEAIALRCGGGGGGGGGGGDGDVESTSDHPDDAIAIGRDDDTGHVRRRRAGEGGPWRRRSQSRRRRRFFETWLLLLEAMS